MLSLENELLKALAAERRLAEERALIPGLLEHDLANVLCQLTLSTGALSAEIDERERANVIRDLNGAVKRMNDLFAGMKHLFLSRSGATDYARSDLATFIVTFVMEPGVWPRDASISLCVPQAMWCTFSPTLVRHILANLVGNAVSYSHQTWVRVRLSPIRGSRWLVSVSNGGPGIPANHLPYLFELGRNAPSAAKSGTPGLGLYIARFCARFHGSILRVRTRPGLTVFSFAIEGQQRSDSPSQPLRAPSHAA